MMRRPRPAVALSDELVSSPEYRMWEVVKASVSELLLKQCANAPELERVEVMKEWVDKAFANKDPKPDRGQRYTMVTMWAAEFPPARSEQDTLVDIQRHKEEIRQRPYLEGLEAAQRYRINAATTAEPEQDVRAVGNQGAG